MKRIYPILYLLLIPSLVSGQRYSLGDLSVAGDKVMLSLIGDDIFNHSLFDTHAAYSYIDENGSEAWAYVKDHEAVKYKPGKIIVQYAIDYPYTKCPIQDHVSGRVTLEFNSKLELINDPDISFIPDFMIANEKCNYLTKDEALAIIKKEKFKDNEFPDDIQEAGAFTFNGKAQLVWSFHYITYKQITVINEEGSTSRREESQTHLIAVNAVTGIITTDATFPKLEDIVDLRKGKDEEKK